MAKKSTILSVSIPMYQAEFLNISELSPSQLLQDKIKEEQVIWNKYHDSKEKLLKAKQSLEKMIQDFYVYLEESETIDVFMEWRKSYVLRQKTNA